MQVPSTIQRQIGGRDTSPVLCRQLPGRAVASANWGRQDSQPSNVQNAPCQPRLSSLSQVAHTPPRFPPQHVHDCVVRTTTKQSRRRNASRFGSTDLRGGRQSIDVGAPAIKSTLPRGCPPRSGDGSRKHRQSSSQSKNKRKKLLLEKKRQAK